MLNNDSTELYTVQEISEMLYASKNTVYKLIKENELPAMRVGRSWLIPHEAFEKFIRKQSGLE